MLGVVYLGMELHRVLLLGDVLDGRNRIRSASDQFEAGRQFDRAGEFSEGLAPVGFGGRYGYIDRRGRIAINPQFDQAGDFAHGLAPVWLGNRQGYIDKNGKYVWMPTA